MSSFDFVKTLFTHLYEILCGCWFDDIESLEGVETVYKFDTIWVVILVDFIVCWASVLKPFIESLLRWVMCQASLEYLNALIVRLSVFTFQMH